jgi:hypothetical protein
MDNSKKKNYYEFPVGSSKEQQIREYSNKNIKECSYKNNIHKKERDVYHIKTYFLSFSKLFYFKIKFSIKRVEIFQKFIKITIK